MAVIELDLTAQPGPPLRSRPPAHRYRLPGLVLLAAVLAVALGGAAPARPTLWRFLGSVPGGGAEFPFRLTGGRAYTVSAEGPVRSVVAWRCRSRRTGCGPRGSRCPVAGPDAVPFGGCRPSRPVTWCCSPRARPRPRWTRAPGRSGGPRRSTSRRWPAAGSAMQQTEVFRPGTVYDQDSGRPRPALLLVHRRAAHRAADPHRGAGIDLATGRARLWSATLPRLGERLPGRRARGRGAGAGLRPARAAGRRTGAVVRSGEPAAGRRRHAGRRRSVGGLVLVDYGDYGARRPRGGLRRPRRSPGAGSAPARRCS